MVLPVIKPFILTFLEILNLEWHINCCFGSKVTAVLLNGLILPSGEVASGRVCPAACAAGLFEDQLIPKDLANKWMNRSKYLAGLAIEDEVVLVTGCSQQSYCIWTHGRDTGSTNGFYVCLRGISQSLRQATVIYRPRLQPARPICLSSALSGCFYRAGQW